MANTIPLAPTMPWWHGPAGGVTTLPLGDTILTDTLYIDNQFGPVLQGQGQFLSGIRWQGPPDRPVIVIRNCTMAAFDVGEVVMYSSALTTGTGGPIDVISTYLKNKWATP